MSTDAIDFDDLYRRFKDDICRMLSRYGGHRVPVEDGLHEVFRIALEEYRPELPAKAWLLKTAFNVAHNWRHRVQFIYELPGVPADEAADGLSPEDWFTLKETKIRIHRVIDSLDPELREVFVLAKIEEIPLTEIAAALELKLSTVRSRLERAKEAFLSEGRRRHAAGVLGVAVLVDASEERLRATVDRWVRYAASATVGGTVVAAWFLSRQPPAQIPIHAERPTVTATRWTVAPAPPVPEPPQHAQIDLVPGSLLPQPSSPDETARDELLLYKRGLNAYNHGRYRDALQFLERHKSLYPHGTTAPLRDNLVHRINTLRAG